MEDIGTEVSLKIRSAIKAKLMELGAFVDDELPDYIMVMVANKRSKQQMEMDLQLFLGSNTANFTGWLHTVLQKLEEVTIAKNLVLSQKKAAEAESSSKGRAPTGGSDADGHKHKHEKRKKSSEGSGKQRAPKGGGGKTSGSGKKSTKTKAVDEGGVAEPRTVGEVVSTLKKEAEPETPAKKSVGPVQDARPSPQAVPSDEDDEDFINIKDDAEAMELLDSELSDPHKLSRSKPPPPKPADEEVDELEQQRANLLRDLKLLDRRPTLFNIIDPNELDIVGPTAHEVELTKMEVADRLGRRSAEGPSVRERLGRRTVSVVHEDRRNQNQDKPTVMERLGKKVDPDSTPARTRPSVMDRLGRKTEERRNPSDEEERRNPEKRPTRMLNIKEALVGELQHGGSSKRPAEQPANEDDEVPRKRSLPSRVVAVKREGEDEYDPTNPAVASVIRVKPRPKVPAAMQATKNLLLRAMADAQKSVSAAPKRQDTQRPESLFTRKYRNSGQQLEKINITVSNPPKQRKEEEAAEEREEEEYKEKTKTKADEPKRESRQEAARKVRQKIVVEEPTEVEAPAEEDPTAAGTEKEAPKMDEEDDDVIYEEIFDDDLNEEDLNEMTVSNGDSNLGNVSPINEYVPTKIGDGLKGTHKAGRASSPQFVVTLDGLDPDIFNPRKRTVDATQVREPEEETGVVSPVPGLDPDTDDRIHNWLLSLDRAKKEEERNEPNASPVANKKPKLAVAPIVPEPAKSLPAERCKYWPTCGKGDACEFLHPSAPCKMFPACKFGDRCLYVHPNCKFDISCTRRECPYSHTGARSGASQAQVSASGKPRTHSQALCKFYPKCSNVNCLFLHPKPCRFGRACTNRDCSFFHEEIPTAEKLKWVNSNRF